MRRRAKRAKVPEDSETNSLNQLHSVRGHSDRSQFVVEETINIFPDTLVWVRDFTYGFNEPLADYFWHPAYDNYPVVGVTWSQAKAFNAWRTQLMNNWRNRNLANQRSKVSDYLLKQNGNTPHAVAWN